MDAADGRSLVIERKSISWPESYAYEHSKDHDLAEEIRKRLSGLQFQQVYSLRIPAVGTASREELSAIGTCVASAIRSHYAQLRGEEVVKFQCQGRTFEFCIQPLEDRDYDQPDCGLVFLWEGKFSWQSPEELGPKLIGQLQKIYAACVQKFATHATSRRILMLDPHGEIQFKGALWWHQLLTKWPPPIDIHEVWMGASGTNDWGEEEWLIEKVFGGSLDLAIPLPIPVEPMDV